MRGGVDVAPDLELTVVVDFDLVEVLDVEVVHGFDLVKFVVDLFFEPKVVILVEVLGVDH